MIIIIAHSAKDLCPNRSWTLVMQYHWKVGESKKSTDSSYEHHGRNHSLPMWLHLNIDITRHMHHLYTFVSVQKPARHSHCPSCGQRGCRRRCGHTPVKSSYKSPTTWPDGCITAKRDVLHMEYKSAAWSLTENLHVINNKRTYHPWPQQDFKLQFVTASYTHSSHLSTSENWHGTQNHQGCHVIPQNEVLQQEAWEFHHHTNKKYVMLTRKDNGLENGMKCT